MVLKLVKTVILSLSLLLQTECLYSGEVCAAGYQSGHCVSLEECPYIIEEIRRAGNPMPLYMRKKLQSIMCGFESNIPLVCCISSFNEHNSHVTDYPDYSSNTRPVTTDNNYINSNSGGSGESGSIESCTTTVSTPQYNNDEPISVENHPNLRLLPTNCGNIESDRIWGGNRTQLFEMPWMVLLSYNSPFGPKLSCGGSLINEWYVLTAAHCVSFLRDLQVEGVILGEYDIRHDPDCEITDGEEECAPKVRNVTVASVAVHPDYTPKKLVHDIALVRLTEPADFRLPSMKALCLPITHALQTQSLVGDNAVVAGWGVTEDGLQSPVLLSVALPVVSHQECEAIYHGNPKIYDNQICAGGIKDKDSCGGDSGGPLMYPGIVGRFGLRYVQRGIVSFGPKRCGIGGYPGVYTNVAYYMKWILDNMY